MALADPILAQLRTEAQSKEPNIPGAIAGGVELYQSLQDTKAQKQQMGIREQRNIRQQQQHEAAMAAAERDTMTSNYIADIFRSSTDQGGQFKPGEAAEKLYQSGIPEAIETANELAGVQQQQRRLDISEGNLRLSEKKFSREAEEAINSDPIWQNLGSQQERMMYLAGKDVDDMVEMGFKSREEAQKMKQNAKAYVKRMNQTDKVISRFNPTDNEYEAATRFAEGLYVDGQDLNTELPGGQFDRYRDLLAGEALAIQAAARYKGQAVPYQKALEQAHNNHKDEIKSRELTIGWGRSELSYDPYNEETGEVKDVQGAEEGPAVAPNGKDYSEMW